MNYENIIDREIQQFKSFFKEGAENDCWLWNGYKLKSGHGQINFRKKVIYAYRLAYFFRYGPFDESLCVLHKCDNGACVNPSHLFLGTKTDNMRDKVEKQRQSKGIFNGGWLTEEEAKEIIRLDKETDIPRTVIARRFKIDVSQVSRIVSGRRWGHLQNNVGMNNAI